MNVSFEEKILNGVREEIEIIISRVKEEVSQTNDISAIELLIRVNNEISTWMEDAKDLINISSEKIAEIIDKTKEEVTLAAKNEVCAHIAGIVTDGKGNVPERINAYVNELEEQGLNLKNNEEEPNRIKEVALDLLGTPTAATNNSHRR